MSTTKSNMKTREKHISTTVAFVVALIFIILVPICAVFAADPVTITSDEGGRDYFEYLNYEGEWVDCERLNHWVEDTGAVAYCMDAGTLSPGTWHSFEDGAVIYDFFGEGRVAEGIRTIFYYGYPSTSPSSLGLTDRQARYATAMAISCWLSENGYPQGSNFYNLSHGSLRSDGTAEGNATWNYMIQLINLARNDHSITHSVTITPTGETYRQDGMYVRSYQITTHNCNSGYTIDAAGLPTGYTLTGYTGSSGDTVTVSIPSSGNSGIEYSFTAIGWDNRTSGNLIVQEPVNPDVQPMMYQLLTPLAGARADGNIEGEDIDIELEKSDRITGDPIAGVEFTVWTDEAQTNVFASAITDANGVATIIDLPAATYYWAETIAAPGYIPDQTLQSFVVNDDGTVSGTFTLENDPIEVVLQKTDDQTGQGLPGAHFVIRNSLGEVIAEGDSGTDGTATFLRIPAGAYTFSETIAPSGYILSNEELPFTVNSDGTVSGTTEMTNTRQRIELILYKNKEAAEWITETSEFNFSEVPAAGITFDVFSAEDILDIHGNVIVSANTRVDTITTNSNGIARTTADLYYGNYYAIESEGTPDVVPDYVTTYPVSLIQVDQTMEIAEFELNGGVPVVNDLVKAYMQINKVAGDTTLPLEGVTFEVYDSLGNLIDELITDENGVATTRLLPYGDYTLIETQTMMGYALSDEEEFAIYVSPEAGIPATQELTVINNRLASIEIYKVSEEWQIPLEGVVFGLYEEGGTLVETATSDVNGSVTFLAPAGSYYIQEITPLPGYTLDPTHYDVGADWGAIFEYRIENQMSQLRVTKTSSNGTLLAGMQFQITNASTGEVLPLEWNEQIGAYLVSSITTNTIGITGSDGTAMVLGMLPGEYIITETDAPDHYNLDSTPVTVNISTSTPMVEALFVNTPVPAPPIPQTGEKEENNSLAWALIASGTVTAGSLVLAQSPKRRLRKNKK